MPTRFCRICAILTTRQSLGWIPKRIAIAGHSMGGWVTAHTAAHDHALMGAILISMGDMGLLGYLPHDQAVAVMADNMETLVGCHRGEHGR